LFSIYQIDKENLIIGVYEGEITEDLLLMNLVICILKWVIWKTRNYIKYNKSTYREALKGLQIFTMNNIIK
jgi:hypothetical protein